MRISLLVGAAVLAFAVGALCAAVGTKATGALASSTSTSSASVTTSPESLPEVSPIAEEHMAEQTVFEVSIFMYGRRQGGATAFLVTSDKGNAYIVTNRHVCEGASDSSDKLFILTGVDGEEYATTELKHASFTDLCVLRAPGYLLPGAPLKLAASDPTKGIRINVFGHPSLRPLTMTAGTVEGFEVIHTDEHDRMGLPIGTAINIGFATSHIEPGSSGSPVLNKQGQVAGVVFATSGEEGFTLFIPVSQLRTLLNSLER